LDRSSAAICSALTGWRRRLLAALFQGAYLALFRLPFRRLPFAGPG
jgi:hypothetical protein